MPAWQVLGQAGQQGPPGSQPHLNLLAGWGLPSGLSATPHPWQLVGPQLRREPCGQRQRARGVGWRLGPAQAQTGNSSG